MGRVVGYVRVSTTEQEHGPRAQRDAIEAWCEANGHELVAVHEDLGVSGAAPLDKRPGLVAALADLNRGDVLAVAKRCRLARDPIVGAMAEAAAARSGASVVSTAGEGTDGDGPSSVLMRRIVDAFAEYERLVIGARTKAALAAKKSRGERVGGVPFGKRVAADGVNLEADPDEQRAVGLVRRLRRDGLSLRAIAERLNDDGIPARGNRWHKSSIARILEAA